MTTITTSALVCFMFAGVAPPDRRAVELNRLIEALGTTNYNQWYEANSAMTAAVRQADVPFLLKHGEDARPGVRVGIFYAVYPFGRIPPTDPQPVPLSYLRRRLKDSSVTVRARCCPKCGIFAQVYPELFHDLWEAFDDVAEPDSIFLNTEERVADTAVFGVTGHPAWARLAVPKLREAMKEGNRKYQRLNAMRAVSNLARQDPSWRPVYLGLLMERAKQSRDKRGQEIANSEALREGRFP